jgi:hypothetical protein
MSGYLWLNIWEGFVGLAFAHMRLLFFGGIFRASGAMTGCDLMAPGVESVLVACDSFHNEGT